MGVGVNLSVYVLAIAVFVVCRSDIILGTEATTCSINELPLPSFILCQDTDNNVIVPTHGVVQDGTLCTFTCTRNNMRTWSYCQQGGWTGETDKCMEDIEPQYNLHYLHNRQKRGWFRRVWRAIKCMFARCRQRRIPKDRTPPQLTCPPDQRVIGDPFQTNAKVTWVAPTAWDSRDGSVTVHRSTSRTSGFPVPEGVTTVGYYARDRSGNMARCTFRIYVTIVRCPQLNRMRDGYGICHRSDDMVRSTYCYFGCYEGHELVGATYAVCLVTGRWSAWTFTQPYCRKHSCPSLLSSSSLLSIRCTNGDYFRSICTFSCASGYDIPNGVKRVAVCGVRKTWSSDVPSCVDVEKPRFKPYPTSMTFYIARSDNTTAVYWSMPDGEDNSGDIISPYQIYGPAQGAKLPLGTYNLAYAATDTAGNTARPLTFKIKVKEIRCFNVYPTPYTTVACTGNRLGSLCQFDCTGAATLNGTVTTTCESEGNPPYGMWDWGPHQPFCELPDRCPLPAAPDNGALACDYWLGGRFCQMQCQQGYGISVRDQHPDLIICNEDGSVTWNSDLPNCMSSRNARGTKRLTEVFYYDGECVDEATQLEIKQNFIEHLTSTSFSHGCDTSPRCSWQFVQVICGNTNGKRSVGFSITFEIFMNSSTDMDEEEYYSQFMEYASLIESLNVDMASGKITLQLNDNTTVDAANVIANTISLACEENTVASTKTFTCVECQSGSYYDTALSECAQCPVGQYQSEPRTSSCVQCPPGMSTESKGSASESNCEDACPPGSWSHTSLPPCTPCDVGYYKDTYGATVCTACPGNTLTENDNITAENQCTEFDVYFPDNQTLGVLFSTVQPTVVTQFTVHWWQQCTDVCHGKVFQLTNDNGTETLSLTLNPTLTIYSDGHSADSGSNPPDDGRWHAFKMLRKNSYIELFMDSVLVDNVTGLPEELSVFGGVIKVGGDSFEGTISQLNIFTEAVSLALDKCSNTMTGDLLGWRSVLNATMNDAFLQIPSVCDDTNECDSNPCMNGNCTDGYHSYQCECDAGYNGNDCADNIDDCMTNSCQNNATCQDGVNGYSCLCQPDFNGDLCEIATIDGSWNDWGNWSECSVTCGNGTRSRRRACDNPTPDNGGAECVGEGNETEVCSEDSCPVCSELVAPDNATINCTFDGEDNVCTLECEDGYLTDVAIPENYTCGNSTFHQWDFKVDTNAYTRLPLCIGDIMTGATCGAGDAHSSGTPDFAFGFCEAQTDPDDLRATSVSYYHDLDCHRLDNNSDARITVTGKLDVALQTLTGVQNSDCHVEENYINECSAMRKRSTSTELAGYTVTLHCDSKTKGTNKCYEILTQAVIELQNMENAGGMNIVVDGIEYAINVSLSEADTSSNCPAGTVEAYAFCVPCGPGRYYLEGECVVCDIGLYQDTEQQTSCKSCPSGTTTEGTGSISMEECSVVLPIEDSPTESDIAVDVVTIVGIASAALIVVILITVVFIRMYQLNSKKKVSDSTIFKHSSPMEHRYDREPSVMSDVSISDYIDEFPDQADNAAKSKLSRSSWQGFQDKAYCQFQNIPPLSSRTADNQRPPLFTIDGHSMRRMPINGRLTSLPWDKPVPKPATPASVSKIDFLYLEDCTGYVAEA